MHVDGALLNGQVRTFEFSNYVRIIPSQHQATPIACTVGNSRFGGTGAGFATLYAARNLATALAEAVVRDRFEGIRERRIFASELSDRTAVQIDSVKPLQLVDLRKGGCLKLGVSTDIAGAKCFDEAQTFSDAVYKQASIDGILYASRLTGENCIAVFDRAIAAHLTTSGIAPLVQLKGLANALDEIQVQLIA